jgi:hypothetical protein
MEPSRPTEEGAIPAVSETVTDALTDQVAAEFTGVPQVSAELTAEPTEQVALEEEQVKDEIEIQIDLLKDPDWVWNRCVMRCATVIGKFGKWRSRGWGRSVLPPLNC